jgi:hypothetical protein
MTPDPGPPVEDDNDRPLREAELEQFHFHCGVYPEFSK